MRAVEGGPGHLALPHRQRRDVRRVCSMFGMEYFPDEGLMTHSLRTAVIDRRGMLVASIEGNQYTPNNSATSC